MPSSPAASYADLLRLRAPAGIVLLLLPCYWSLTLASGQGIETRLLVLFAIGAAVMRPAGCILNDLADRRFDAAVARTASRPLASGAISPAAALIAFALLCLTGLWAAAQLGGAVLLLALLSLPLVAAYPFMKRITWWPQAFLGLTFNWGALMGWAAVTGSLGWPALWLYAAGFFWTLTYDTIYAHQDREEDALIGVKSTARRFGEATPHWLLGFNLAMLACLFAAGVSASVSLAFYLALAPLGLWLEHQRRRVNIHDGPRCAAQFREHGWIGAYIWLLCGIAAFRDVF